MLLSAHTFVTLDGVMQAPAASDEDRYQGFNRGGWLVPHAGEMGGVVDEDWFAYADAVLLGQTTYQLMEPYWSAVTDPDNLVATVLNGHPKDVVSTTLTSDTANWADTELITMTYSSRWPGSRARPAASCRCTETGSSSSRCRRQGWSTCTGCWSSQWSSAAANDSSARAPPPTGFKVVSQKFAGSLVALELEPIEYSAGEVGVTDEGTERV